MTIKGQIKGSQVTANLWIEPENVESAALDQVRNVASLEPVKHVSIMSDVHLGKGACIGSVIAMKDAIAPSLTGVDLSCGMTAMKLNIRRRWPTQDMLQDIYDKIQKRIPTGFNKRETAHKVARECELMENFDKLSPELQEFRSGAECSLGTLGGGNHFIEISYDQFDNVWIMLHSGSRNIGYKIADLHIKKAKELMPHGLPDKNLAYFTSDQPEYHNYLRDLAWAHDYAYLNRDIMLWEVFDIIGEQGCCERLAFSELIRCHHNFAQEEEHFGEKLNVIRKGAISAKEGEFGIIPGAMGRDSYIVKGKGNPESLNSAPHGAGRVMSRSKAKKTFTVEELEESLEGIIARKDKSVLDEIGGSYKDINRVMDNSRDLVEPVAKLNQLLCVKG